MRLSLFSRCLLVLFLAPVSLLAQVHLGDSHAQQQLNVAQQWLQGKRYSVVAAIVVDLKDHPDKVVAQKAAEIEDGIVAASSEKKSWRHHTIINQ